MRAEHSLRERNVEVVDQVVSLTAESRVRSNPDLYVQITVGAAAGTGSAAARESQCRPVVDPGRDLHCVGPVLDRAPIGIAGRARVVDDLAQSAAAPAGTGRHHLTEYRLPDAANLPSPSALAALRRSRTRFCTRAVTILAADRSANRDLMVASEHHFLEVEVDMRFEIFPSGRTRMALSLIHI